MEEQKSIQTAKDDITFHIGFALWWDELIHTIDLNLNLSFRTKKNEVEDVEHEVLESRPLLLNP